MYSSTKWNKKLQDQDAYQSSWDWTVAHSEYHFDKNIQDQQGEWYEVLGVFKGDWKEESDRLVKVNLVLFESVSISSKTCSSKICKLALFFALFKDLIISEPKS